jgi:hypothetical protein
LDERRGDSQLNGSARIVTFDVRNRLRVRKIRLRQIGPNHSGNHVLVFVALEFFGDLLRHSSWKRMNKTDSIKPNSWWVSEIPISKLRFPPQFQRMSRTLSISRKMTDGLNSNEICEKTRRRRWVEIFDRHRLFWSVWIKEGKSYSVRTAGFTL